MATFLNAKVIEADYPTDFVIDQPTSGAIFMPGWAIAVYATAESPSKVVSARTHYNAGYEAMSVDNITGEVQFEYFTAALGQEAIIVEVTWANGTVISKQVNFSVLAA